MTQFGSKYVQRKNTPRPPMARRGLNVGTVASLADLFDTLGFTGHADRLHQAVDQHRAITADHKAAEAALADTWQSSTVGVAEGTVSVAEAAQQVNEAERSTPDATTHREVVRQAQRQVLRDAANYLRAQGDGLIVELDQLVGACADSISANASKVDGIETDAQAIRSTGAVAKAWQTIVSNIDTMETAWHLAHRLRFDELVGTLPPPSEHPSYWQYRRPDLLPRPMAGTAAHIVAVTNGASPGALTAEEFVDLHVVTGDDAA